jgi:hypothetical protein
LVKLRLRKRGIGKLSLSILTFRRILQHPLELIKGNEPNVTGLSKLFNKGTNGRKEEWSLSVTAPAILTFFTSLLASSESVDEESV